MDPQPLPQQQMTPPEPTPVNQPIKPSSKRPLLIVLLSVVILCFLGLLLYQNIKLQQQVADLRVTPTPQVSPTPSFISIVNWKMHIDTERSFTFLYPPEMQIIPNLEQIPDNSLYVDIMKINLTSAIKQMSLDNSKLIEIPIAGRPSEYFRKGYFQSNYNGIIAFFPLSNNQTLSISLAVDDIPLTDKNVNDQFDRILSTFKFLEPTVAPVTTINVLNLTYTIPPGWTTMSDPTGTFQVSFDPNTTQLFEGGATGLNLNKKILNNDQIGYKSLIGVELFPYTGGSKHQFIYDHMNNGMKPTKQDYMSGYKETEYQYMGKTCLFLNGISISQYPTVWVMCDSGDNQAFLIKAYDPQNFLQTVQTIKKIQ